MNEMKLERDSECDCEVSSVGQYGNSVECQGQQIESDDKVQLHIARGNNCYNRITV